MRSALAVALLVVGAACTPRSSDRATTDSAAPAHAATTAPDTAEVLAAERAVWEAIKRHDWVAVDSATADMTIDAPTGWERLQPGTWAKQFGDSLITKDYSWTNVHARVVAPSVVLLTYRANLDQTFRGQKLPSPQDFLSLFRREGARWKAVAHLQLPVASGAASR